MSDRDRELASYYSKINKYFSDEPEKPRVESDYSYEGELPPIPTYEDGADKVFREIVEICQKKDLTSTELTKLKTLLWEFIHDTK